MSSVVYWVSFMSWFRVRAEFDPVGWRLPFLSISWCPCTVVFHSKVFIEQMKIVLVTDLGNLMAFPNTTFLCYFTLPNLPT